MSLWILSEGVQVVARRYKYKKGLRVASRILTNPEAFEALESTVLSGEYHRLMAEYERMLYDIEKEIAKEKQRTKRFYDIVDRHREAIMKVYGKIIDIALEDDIYRKDSRAIRRFKRLLGDYRELSRRLDRAKEVLDNETVYLNELKDKREDIINRIRELRYRRRRGLEVIGEALGEIAEEEDAAF